MAATRIHTAETPHHIEEEILLMGWVATRRDHGKLIFIDLRDRWGIAQVVFSPKDESLFKKAERLRSEWVVKIEGTVRERPKGMENAELATGAIEIKATSLEILAESKTPPFALDTDGYEIGEEHRLKYRYLDLRRERLQKNIAFRSTLLRHARDFLLERDFIEIETPLLTKSTPEGSRDFVVPSRLQSGKFYALPQSPQQYKQLLMIAGFERYFQMARCLRDEDLRADRGFEHTQIDLEMSFAQREGIMELVEELIISVCEKLGLRVKEKPFPRFSYKEATERFGADKFDLRDETNKKDDTHAFAWVTDFPFFERDQKSPSGWTYTHNPFSDPLPEHKEKLLAGEIESVATSQYDLVCDGFEVAGGSIRSTDPKILAKVFEVLGYEKTAIENQFGHMLEAFSYGVPPHGGIAIGLERLLMTLLGEEYLREVQAFPMSSGGATAVMDAPAELEEKQLKELHIKVNPKP